MDRFQILKGVKPPTTTELRVKQDKAKLRSVTDAYEALKKKPSTDEHICDYCVDSRPRLWEPGSWCDNWRESF